MSISLEERESFMKYCKGIFNFNLEFADGNNTNYYRQSCYARAFLFRHSHAITGIVIGYPKSYGIYDETYFNWIVNHKFWGEVFLTKSYEDFLRYGMELNLSLKRAKIKKAVNMFRTPIECIEQGFFERFHYFLEKDFTEDQAAFLTFFTIGECEPDKFAHANWEKWHMPFLFGEPFPVFMGESYSYELDEPHKFGLINKNLDQSVEVFGLKILKTCEDMPIEIRNIYGENFSKDRLKKFIKLTEMEKQTCAA